jgi:hypothetical protein
MNRMVSAFLLLFLMFSTACTQKPSQTINPEVLVSPTAPPQPESGKATIQGRVMHEDGYPMAKTIVRLADVARGAEGRGGAFILDLARSPGTLTDENGFFVFPNLDAGEYVIVIGDVEITGIYEIIHEADGKAKIWNFPADQITDVGVITVNVTFPTAVPTSPSGYYPAPTSYPNP